MSQSTASLPAARANPSLRDWVVSHQLMSFFSLSYGIIFAANFFAMAFKLPYYYFYWFLAAFSPTIAALGLSAVIGGKPEVMKLLRGYTRFKVGAGWYLAALLLFILPLLVALVFQATGGKAPGLAPGVTAASLAWQFVFTILSGPLAEEGGWRGFALPRLQARYSALTSSLILGVIWTCWHIPLYFYPDPASRMFFPAFLALTTFLAAYMTWLYNNTRGSLVIVILAHFSFNCVGGFLTGTLGMMPMSVLLTYAVPGLALLFLAVLAYAGPRRLSRKPDAELPIYPNI